MKYDKPPLSIDEQIGLLVFRGMIIHDRARAARYLTHINYYRLRAYRLPFEEHPESVNHRFQPGTRFEDALSFYNFPVANSIERDLLAGWDEFAISGGDR